MKSKQRQFKSDPKIIINQIDLGWLICNFVLDFQHIMMTIRMHQKATSGY
jgi:hypothetical protein